MVTATQDLKNLVDHHRAQVDRAAQTNAKILCRKLREAGIMVESWRDYMGGVVLKGGTAEMLDWNDDLVETEFQDVVNLHCWISWTAWRCHGLQIDNGSCWSSFPSSSTTRLRMATRTPESFHVSKGLRLDALCLP